MKNGDTGRDCPAPSCRTERSGERHLNTENYTIFKFFLSLNSKTFILKLFRYILPIFFFFLSLGAVAQMDKDGNFHWDELYTPDEILELDMSLPNKVDVSAIKNRERVKYVKLKCYPWIEHIPFTPETGEFVLKIENKYAKDYLERLEAKYKMKPVVKILPLKVFFMAEEYHQDYGIKNPEKMVCELKESGRLNRKRYDLDD